MPGAPHPSPTPHKGSRTRMFQGTEEPTKGCSFRTQQGAIRRPASRTTTNFPPPTEVDAYSP